MSQMQFGVRVQVEAKEEGKQRVPNNKKRVFIKTKLITHTLKSHENKTEQERGGNKVQRKCKNQTENQPESNREHRTQEHRHTQRVYIH